jgi:hypothetical protein
LSCKLQVPIEFLAISLCHLTKLTNILSKASRGKYGKDRATEIKELAKNSIGTCSLEEI